MNKMINIKVIKEDNGKSNLKDNKNPKMKLIKEITIDNKIIV